MSKPEEPVVFTRRQAHHPLFGRKLLAFIVMAVLQTAYALIMTRTGAPENVVVQGQYMIMWAALLVIGGQSAIDAIVPVFGKVVPGRPAEVTVKEESTTVKTETVK